LRDAVESVLERDVERGSHGSIIAAMLVWWFFRSSKPQVPQTSSGQAL
jgi:hypothetical protein